LYDKLVSSTNIYRYTNSSLIANSPKVPEDIQVQSQNQLTCAEIDSILSLPWLFPIEDNLIGNSPKKSHAFYVNSRINYKNKTIWVYDLSIKDYLTTQPFLSYQEVSSYFSKFLNIPLSDSTISRLRDRDKYFQNRFLFRTYKNLP
jgi:hypothetical protein